jgi:molybdopterin synthase catalytic subunit
MAVNEAIAPTSTVLADGDTVAFIPQVAGGSDSYCRLTDQPLSVDELLAAVAAPGQGGIVVFIGNVRDHNQGHEVTHLHYEAYPAMVYRTLESIIERCEAIGEGVKVAVAHRTGNLEIGDSAVIIAAAAPHRPEAFQAARMCIELLKEETPIWKKEFSPDGVEWVGTRP